MLMSLQALSMEPARESVFSRGSAGVTGIVAALVSISYTILFLAKVAEVPRRLLSIFGPIEFFLMIASG